MQNDQCVYSRSLLDRLNAIMQGSGNLSQFQDMQMSNPTTSNLSNIMIDESLKINPGLVLMVVMMMVVGLMAMRNKRKQQQPESKLE